jgi:hypothetical protein
MAERANTERGNWERGDRNRDGRIIDLLSPKRDSLRYPVHFLGIHVGSMGGMKKGRCMSRYMTGPALERVTAKGGQ